MNVTDEVCRARCDAARYAGEVEGRADERAAIVAWLKVLPFHPMLTVEDVIESIERGEHEVKKPDQCTDCGALIVGAHGCQGVPGDEES